MEAGARLSTQALHMTHPMKKYNWLVGGHETCGVQDNKTCLEVFFIQTGGAHATNVGPASSMLMHDDHDQRSIWWLEAGSPMLLENKLRRTLGGISAHAFSHAFGRLQKRMGGPG